MITLVTIKNTKQQWMPRNKRLMHKTNISVILPTYNGARFLKETLESFASQLLPINQLVCSDDSSDDDTVAIINDFANTVSFEVICLNHKRDGVTANYLNALASVKGDLILVADQDDVWLDNKTELVVQAMSDSRISLISHDCLLVDDTLSSLGRTLRGSKDQSKVLSSNLNTASEEKNLEIFLRGKIPLLAHTLAFRSELISTLLNKPENIDDWWFEEWVSCIALTHGRLELLKEHLVLYRQHGNQTSGGFENSPPQPFKIASGIRKYDSRIEKINYCAELIKDDDKRYRRFQSLSEYSCFLKNANLA